MSLLNGDKVLGVPLLNLGGPGWFNDVFEVHVEFDSELRVLSRGAIFAEECHVFDPDGCVSGTVTLTAPDGCEVPHRGVELRVRTQRGDGALAVQRRE